MAKDSSRNPRARRSFLARLGTAAAGAGTVLAAGTPALGAQASAPAGWQPARHPQDDWLSELPGKHRFVCDTTSPDGLGMALLFVNNYFEANKAGYGLADPNLAVVIVVRHHSTAFAYSDAMWAKYAQTLGPEVNYVDPATKQAPTANPYMSASFARTLPSSGNTLDALIKRGLHLAVCQMATRRLAGSIARVTNGDADAVYKELTSNLVGNSHMMAAGIVAVNRAQERGYAFVHAG